MKRETISVPFNTEKLEALRQYRTGEQLQEELESVLQALYEKHVPTDVRERIEAAYCGE
jgi:hypothetical protein